MCVSMSLFAGAVSLFSLSLSLSLSLCVGCRLTSKPSIIIVRHISGRTDGERKKERERGEERERQIEIKTVRWTTAPTTTRTTRPAGGSAAIQIAQFFI